MALQTKTFNQLVSDAAQAIQGYASSLVDFTIGSILRAITEANAAIVLWLQQLILQVLALTRAATSTGTSYNTASTDANGNPLADLDSFYWDFGFQRLPATYATGSVTFSRFTAGQQAVVPIGAIVQTSDGSQKFKVTVDVTNAYYSVNFNGYVLNPNSTSITVPVQALSLGSHGNVGANAINTIAQTIIFVDTVNNASPLQDGNDPETDAKFRARFIQWINSLSKATLLAINYTLKMLASVTSSAIIENYSYSMQWTPGYFQVIIDDGTGYPSNAFITTVYNAIDSIRPACSSFGVFAPVVETANVNMTIVTGTGIDHAAATVTVKNAIQTYINDLGIGVGLSFSRMYQVAYDAVAGITDITGVTLNAGSADVAVTNQQIIRAGTINIL